MNDWIDMEAIRHLSRAFSLHLVACIEALAVVWLTGKAVNLGFSQTWVGATIHLTEEMVAIGLFLWLAYQLGVHLWNRRIRVEP